MFSAATLLRRAGLHRGIVRRGVESLVSCAPNRALTCAVAAGAWAAVASVATHGDGARACFSRDVFGAEEGKTEKLGACVGAISCRTVHCASVGVCETCESRITKGCHRAHTRAAGDALPRQTIDGVWIVRAIITDKSGESCFRVLHIPVASTRGTDPNSLGALSKLFSATGLQFRQTPGNCESDHPRDRLWVMISARGVLLCCCLSRWCCCCWWCAVSAGVGDPFTSLLYSIPRKNVDRRLPCLLCLLIVVAADKYDWHRAPRRQFIVNLDAAVRVTASAPGAGSITLQPGEVFWVGDTTGKGHRSQAVNGKARRSLFITVPDDLDVEQWLQGDA